MCRPFHLLAGQRPRLLGVKDGKFLAKVKSSPNNVSSQVNQQLDPEHYIVPLSIAGTVKDAMPKLNQVVQNMKRTSIVEATDNYLYAEFRTFLGFVDDVEFYLVAVPNSVDTMVHVRSSSRIGYGDQGVNRNRVEEIRKRLVGADSIH